MSSTPYELYEKHPLSKFMRERKTLTKDVSFTGMSGGKWFIEEKDSKLFYDLLHDYLFVKKGRALNIVEQPRLNESKPLMIDLDFQYSSENNMMRTFEEPHILRFCKYIGNSIKKFFETSSNELRFFVTMREGPYKESSKPYHKDGIHILCPDITLINDKQKVIRNYILKNNYLNDAFEGTGYNNVDTKVYDEAMTRKQGWFPYGESKANVVPYLLNYVFTFNVDENTWRNDSITDYSSRDLLELLSIRYNIAPDTNTVREELEDEYFLALNERAVTKEKEQNTSVSTVVPTNNVQTTVLTEEDVKNIMMNTPQQDEKDFIRRLVLECLKKERAEAYEDLIKLGWTLHNIEKSEEMFNLWMEFSRFSPKFKENDVRQLHRNFERMRDFGDGPRLTERSLQKWAKEDNPEGYKKIIEDFIFEYIRQQVEGTHYHITQLMKKLYKNNYVASVNNKNTDWYWYDDVKNMWKHLNQGVQLKNKISTEVASYIMKVQEEYSRQGFLSSKKDEKEAIAEKIKKFLKIQMNLYTNGFVESTMKMAEGVFRDEDFTNKLNSNGNLFACNNGVLELRVISETDPTPRVVFRPGIPEDYLSFLAGYNFNEMPAIDYKPYDPTNPIYIEIFDFFNKIFPDRALRDYVLRVLSSCLEGTNREQCYYTWIGVGSNGKSKLVELMRYTFGDYQTSLQSTVLTRKRPESGAANPDIIAIKNRRFIYLQEPDYSEPLNTSRMKQLSGEDMIEARKLYGDQEKFKVMGKLFMMCNKLPAVKTMDRGTWRRIRVMPFVSKFVDATNAEYIAKKPNVFLIDRDMDSKLLKWREPFLSLLVHIYTTQYLVNGLEPIPESVTAASNSYKESNDSFARFYADRIKKDANSKATFKEINSAYKNWSEMSAGSASRISSQDLENRLNEEFGEPRDKKHYMGIRVFKNEEELENFEQDS